jgi:uncharacterized protein (TIGR01777 family)
MSRILIAGATGLIGSALVAHWQEKHELTVLGRSSADLQQKFPGLRGITWESVSAEDIANQDVVINLTGANIAGARWTARYRRVMVDSRLSTTRRLVGLMMALGSQAPRLFNASAIGVYGLPATEAEKGVVYDESSPLPSVPQDFLAEIGALWEAAVRPAEAAGVSVVRLRFGVVLSDQGGALAKMLPSFRWGMGAVLGDGAQPVSWVALPDLVAAIDYLLARPEQTGAFNIVASTDSQRIFASSLASYLQRPCLMRLPAFLVRALFGEMGEALLLQGQSVFAKRLSDLGFVFQASTLPKAWVTVLKKE